jgi:hypothetical protein
MRHASVVLLTLILAVAFAQAQEVPHRKSGLWELKRTSSLSQGEATFQMCVDQASDDPLRQFAENMKHGTCNSSSVRRAGDKLTVDAVCRIGRNQPITATTHAVLTGDFDSKYTIESKSTFDPPWQGNAQGSALLEAKWTGPCKADQRAGDLILPNGMKVNLNKASKSGGKKQGVAAPNTNQVPGTAAR